MPEFSNSVSLAIEFNPAGFVCQTTAEAGRAIPAVGSAIWLKIAAGDSR
jgi:hypothetical protein